ncbi:MAG TPA: HAD family hydrolase, partial [Anaerolineae bacterium]|nr:HAD family hydrolase [Anaerolineae bacterium]
TLTALERFMAMGGMVVLATGKSYRSATDMRRQLGLGASGVYVQGLVIHDEAGEIIEQILLAPEIVAELDKIVREWDVDLIAYSGREVYTPFVTEVTDGLMIYHEPRPQQIERLTDYELNKVMFIGDLSVLAGIRAKYEHLFEGKASFLQAVPNSNMLEVVPVNSSKGAGVAKLLKRLGRSAERMLAVGDGDNDKELLALAAIGVAMGNGAEGLKEMADFVTADNEHDGVALALERFVLKDRSD